MTKKFFGLLYSTPDETAIVLNKTMQKSLVSAIKGELPMVPFQIRTTDDKQLVVLRWQKKQIVITVRPKAAKTGEMK